MEDSDKKGRKAKMKRLNEDLKTRNFGHIYLLYGEEAYLKKHYKRRFQQAILPEGDTMNFSYFEGKDTNITEVIDIAQTMPFFSERRLIVLENTGFLKNACPQLADYLKAVPESTYFLLIENEVDKRGRVYKAVKEHGHITELARQDADTLTKWILGLVKREGKKIAASTVRYFLEKEGTDMENLQNELEKLFSYTMERDSITAEDIDVVCTSQIKNKIFDMVDAVALKDQRRALQYYYDLLALKEPPMRILYLLTRQFRILLQTKELVAQGADKKQIAEKIKVPPFSVGKYQNQARMFYKEEIVCVLERAADMEEAVKTGRLSDTLSVELFIVEFSREKEKK